MKKRVINLIILSITSAIMIGGLSGCKSNEETGTESNAETEIRFAWWGGADRHEATLEAINAYETANPGVKIKAEYSGLDGYYQKLVTQLSGNTAPDIIQFDTTWIPEITSQGDFFIDLESEDVIDKTTFDATFMNQYARDKNGTLIGLPTGTNAATMIFNKDFFDEYGIPQDVSLNWDNLLEYGRQVSSTNPEAHLLNFDSITSHYLLKAHTIQQTGNQWINEDYTLGFERENLLKSFTYIDELYKSGVIQPIEESAPFDTKTEQNTKWSSGDLGMVLAWTSMFPTYQSPVPDHEMGLTLQPISPDAKDTGVIVRPSQLIAINNQSSSKEEAVKFLEWFFNSEEAAMALKDVRGIPASSVARDALSANGLLDTKLSDATEEAMANMGQPNNGISQNQELEKMSRDIIQSLALGEITPEEATDTLIESYLQKLEEFKN